MLSSRSPNEKLKRFKSKSTVGAGVGAAVGDAVGEFTPKVSVVKGNEVGATVGDAVGDAVRGVVTEPAPPELLPPKNPIPNRRAAINAMVNAITTREKMYIQM